MANVETLEGLERRVSMTLPAAEIERQVDARLKQLARNIKMPGFRPGKVPMKIVAQTYGPQVRNEVLGDAVQKSFSDAVKEAKLRVAGYPKIEKKEEKPTDAAPATLEFSAGYHATPSLALGLNGYIYRQTTDDKLNGLAVNGNGNRGRVNALGPYVSYSFTPKVTLIVKLQSEFGAHNKPEGTRLWGQMRIPF